MSSTPETPSPDTFGYPGPTASISANGLSNGITWDVDRGTNQLRAYSSDSYATELWTSDQAPNARDALGAAVKFQVPTVVNGRVYVGAGTGEPNNFLVVYGPIPPPTGAPSAPADLIAQPTSGTTINVTWTDTSTAPNTADSYYFEQSTDGISLTQIAASNAINYTVTRLATNSTY